jgi:hypothetical protein
MGEWRYSSTILDLGTRWRWVVSFMPWPLYPWGKREGGWVGPRACSFPCQELNPSHPAHTPFSGGKADRVWDDYSCPASTKQKNVWCITSTLPYHIFMVCTCFSAKTSLTYPFPDFHFEILGLPVLYRNFIRQNQVLYKRVTKHVNLWNEYIKHSDSQIAGPLLAAQLLSSSIFHKECMNGLFYSVSFHLFLLLLTVLLNTIQFSFSSVKFYI